MFSGKGAWDGQNRLDKALRLCHNREEVPANDGNFVCSGSPPLGLRAARPSAAALVRERYAMPRSYLNFDLLVIPASGRYSARVIQSPVGEGKVDFDLPFSSDELQGFWQRAGRRTRHLSTGPASGADEEDVDAQGFGARLFDQVFTGQIGQAFMGSLQRAQDSGQGLRIRLRLGDAPELADLPWEFLYSRELGRFLAPSGETPVLRYLELAQGERPLTVAPPLRIVAVVSDPSDVEKLNVEQEWARLQEALHDRITQNRIELTRLDQPTLGALQRRLRRADVHVLHFIGHGFFDAQSNQGGLVFEEEGGQGRRVSAEQLGTLLHDRRTLCLVFLNACEGARGGSTMPFAGVAQKLVQQRVPAVLAMQFAVSDAVAIALAYEFYCALADGIALDEAVSEARKAIFVTGETFEWGTPVLFSRSPDGVILSMAKDEEQPMAQRADSPWWEQIQAGGIHATGDVIIATIGAGASNVAVGKQINQLVGPPTPDDRQVILAKFADVDAALSAQQARDAATMQVAELQLQLLRGELTKTEEKETPSASAITLAGNWLLDNLPDIAESLAGLFATPAVGRVVGKAGEAAVTWVKERFGKQ
jgi:hypothetical protein